MNNRLLEESFKTNKKVFIEYINNIKNNMPIDIYSVTNITLISNPYSSDFPKKFFLEILINKSNKLILFLLHCIKFYARNFYALFSYIISFFIFKIVYKKNKIKKNNNIYLDVFFLVDNINKDGVFIEKYFSKIYPVLKKHEVDYTFIPRLFGAHKNPIKLIKFFKIMNKDKNNFLFEFELLSFFDILYIVLLILKYPFKTLRLLQIEDTNINKLFNNELIKDISKQQFDAFSRFVFGKNIAKIKSINDIYSWSEFQVIERAFNYAIRIENTNITLHGCQFYLNYETYFNSYLYDVDENNKTAYHEVLVNGKYYIKEEKLIKYNLGVSLRYSQVFEFNKEKVGKEILVLGSFIENDTRYMLECAKVFEKIIFKEHPALPNTRLDDMTSTNIRKVNENIYTLFKNTKLVISSASGTCVEAVACGIPVIVIASYNNLTANPLVEYGKGKIWDIVYNKDDMNETYRRLLSYKIDNNEEVDSIGKWYRENFFIKPIEKNIVRAFDLDEKRNIN